MSRPQRKRPKAPKTPQALPIRSMPRGDFVQDLHKRREILISVQGRRTGRTFTFPVWFVVKGETLWLLPVRGKRTQWYKNIQINPTLAIRSGHLYRTFAVHPVDHPKTLAAVIAAFQKKYTSQNVARYYNGIDVGVEVPLNPRYSPVTSV